MDADYIGKLQELKGKLQEFQVELQKHPAKPPRNDPGDYGGLMWCAAKTFTLRQDNGKLLAELDQRAVAFEKSGVMDKIQELRTEIRKLERENGRLLARYRPRIAALRKTGVIRQEVETLFFAATESGNEQ